MGKTTLVEAFLSELADHSESWVGRGYCIEHIGPVEAYSSILEALDSLGQGPFRDPLVQVLRQVAPSWLMQLPTLIPESDHPSLHPEIPASTRVRMIRELVAALGVLSAEQLVVLVLEDLHWSDPSIIDLLGAVIGRREPAQLLILSTYRPLELEVNDHPLKGLLQECQAHGQEQDIRLTPLSTASIKTFLGHRLQGAIDDGLVTLMGQRSDGNPLFLERLLDYMIEEKLLIEINGQWQLLEPSLAEQALPNGVRQLLTKQMNQFPERVQEALQVASVAGMQFTTAAVAAGVDVETGSINEALAWAATKSYFLQAEEVEVWPDGTTSGGITFGTPSIARPCTNACQPSGAPPCYLRIGERLEKAYLDDLEPVVGRLAHHFTEGRDIPRALQYLHAASVKALSRLAANEAMAHLNRALELLPSLPAERNREQIEFDLQNTFGSAIIAARGVSVTEAEAAYERAYRLGQVIGDLDQLFPTLVGLENMANAKADYSRSQHLAGQLLNYAQLTQDPLHFASAYRALSINHTLRGHFLVAHDYAKACRSFPIPPDHLRQHPYYTLDPIITCQFWEAVVLKELGYPDQAVAISQANLARAHQLGDSLNMIYGLASVVLISRHCHPATVEYEAAQALVDHATHHGRPLWELIGTFFLLRARTRLRPETDSVAQLEAALEMHWRSPFRQAYSNILLMGVDVYYDTGCLDAGLALLQEIEAFINVSGERLAETELHWQRGRLLQRQGHVREAESRFVHALTRARQLQAKGTELRVAMLLSRLWQEQGEREKARQLLTPIYHSFTEGFETAELQEAKGLLDELA